MRSPQKARKVRQSVFAFCAASAFRHRSLSRHQNSHTQSHARARCISSFTFRGSPRIVCMVFAFRVCASDGGSSNAAFAHKDDAAFTQHASRAGSDVARRACGARYASSYNLRVAFTAPAWVHSFALVCAAAALRSGFKRHNLHAGAHARFYASPPTAWRLHRLRDLATLHALRRLRAHAPPHRSRAPLHLICIAHKPRASSCAAIVSLHRHQTRFAHAGYARLGTACGCRDALCAAVWVRTTRNARRHGFARHGALCADQRNDAAAS